MRIFTLRSAMRCTARIKTQPTPVHFSTVTNPGQSDRDLPGETAQQIRKFVKHRPSLSGLEFKIVSTAARGVPAR